MNNPKIVFFGAPEFSVKILESMKDAGFKPALIITAPDKPKGRKMIMSPSPVKLWAEEKNIPVEHNYDNLKSTNADLFVVASFGKILPKEVLEVPRHGTLNVHPSLLPELRGPSPIQTAILEGKEKTGVTIMLMNEKMDEGAILAQRELEFLISNFEFLNLENELAELGGKLLVKTIPRWISGEIKPQEQNHSQATYSKLLKKQAGEIDWNEPVDVIERKIRAFTPWPSAYTFLNDKRIIIISAKMENDTLKIERVKPEGKNEIDFQEFLRSNPNFLSLSKKIGKGT
ncbi:methionyl-tRNA formyltransferase [Patescibacteria group bacterium]